MNNYHHNNNSSIDTASSSIVDIRQSTADEQFKIETSMIEFDNTHYHPTFVDLKADHGWKYAAIYKVKHYFPHYKLQTSGKVAL